MLHRQFTCPPVSKRPTSKFDFLQEHHAYYDQFQPRPSSLAQPCWYGMEHEHYCPKQSEEMHMITNLRSTQILMWELLSLRVYKNVGGYMLISLKDGTSAACIVQFTRCRGKTLEQMPLLLE